MNSNIPHILIISSRANTGAGGETYLMSVLRHIDRNRFSPIIALPAEGTLIPVLNDMDIPYVVVGNEYGYFGAPDPWYKLLGNLQGAVVTLSEVIRDRNIAIVHTNSNFRLEGAMAARLTGTRHLYLAHIEYQPEMPIFRRFPITPASYAGLMGELSDKVIAVSDSVAETLRPMIPEGKLGVVHNGIELEAFDAKAAEGGSIREELDIPPDSVLVSAVGRMNPDKGFDLFVEAAGIALREAENVHFLLIGGREVDSFEAQIRQRVEQLDITPNFHFLGHRKDVPSILRQSDIFVLSSRREGHPYVMLEAMAASCAVVACNCAGVEETIANGSNGFFVDLEDVEGISGRLLELVRTPSLRTRMGDAARRHIEEHFQATLTTNRLMDTYDELLSSPPPIPGSPAIDLFLQSATELSLLGKKQLEMEQRLRKAERLSALVLDNFVVRTLRSLRNRISG